MKKYIIEIEKNEEVITDGAYLTPDEIVDEVMYNDFNGDGESYNRIALVDTLDDARKIFNENKNSCSSKQVGRKLTADILRIRETYFDNEGNELNFNGMEIVDTFAAMLDGYVLSENNKAVDFEIASSYMDDEIRESLHGHIELYDDQEFFSAYEKKHWEKYDESFAESFGIEY
jgi:hypothetical protein